MRKKLAYTLALILINTVVHSTPGWSSTDKSTKLNPATADAAKPFSVEGRLSCTFSRTGTFVAFVSIISREDGSKLSVSEPSSELKEQCRSQDVNSKTYSVQGRLTPRFLLWGGNLKVDSFEAKKIELGQNDSINKL